MKIRGQFLPRKSVSIGAFIFISLVIPTIYWFELFVVLPSLYQIESLQYWVHFVLGNLLMLNVISSYVGLLVIDTSVKGHLKHKYIQSSWKQCEKCNIKVPPRSWHCSVCNTCMLKRDHHCLFTGYCVGHHNHRLFIMFVFYALLSCLYATVYNYYFFGMYMELSKFLSSLLFSVPSAILLGNITVFHCYLIICQIVIYAALLLLVLFIYHFRLVISGSVAHERKHNISNYDMGFKQNVINVFGEKWYLSWVSPLITSHLPNEGFSWKTKVNLESNKEY